MANQKNDWGKMKALKDLAPWCFNVITSIYVALTVSSASQHAANSQLVAI